MKRGVNWRKRGNHSSRNERGEHSRPENRALDKPKHRGNGEENKHFFRKDNAAQHQTSKDPRNAFLSFKYVESLLNNTPEEAVMELSKNEERLKNTLKTDLTSDFLVLLINLTKKICESHFPNLKIRLLQIIFSNQFINKLTVFITRLVTQTSLERKKSSYFWKNPDLCIENIIEICNTVLEVLPSYACEVLPPFLKTINMLIPNLETEQDIVISETSKGNVKILLDLVEGKMKEIEEKQKKKYLKHDNTFEDPPDDFREISIYPTSAEILQNSRGFLRKNIVKGPYTDVNHYLDVQFRLLREDFLGPLRQGIIEYKQKTKKRIQNVRIHKRIHFLQSETVSEGYCVRIKFDFKAEKKTFKYENSKRFMYGSLMCFTHDNFETVLFGRVQNKKKEDLEKGEIIVAFDEQYDILYNTDYLMVECNIYFEPYYHVLKAMQNIEVENFPMQKYIVYVNPTPERPKYQGERYLPFEPFDLNESQERAFRAALSQEFSIIQGPPGTGKTFLGLKIAEQLFSHTFKQLWRRKGPMLIICYTNHALDQFLGGLSRFTNNIIRVGGQSKEEAMEQFNLKSKTFKKNATTFRLKHEVNNCLCKIKQIENSLTVLSRYDCILDFSVFMSLIPNYAKSWFREASPKDVATWLLNSSCETLLLQNESWKEEVEVLESSDEEDMSDARYATPVDDVFLVNVKFEFNTILNLHDLKNQLENINCELYRLNNNQMVMSEYDKIVATERLLVMRDELRKSINTLEKNFGIANGQKDFPRPRYINVFDPYKMPPNYRWQLYFYWLNIYRTNLFRKHDDLSRQFRKLYKDYCESKDLDNLSILKDADAIGMTTTCAARMQNSLQVLESPIVIIEEAAEVLEAHIITALTEHCQHLIMIGDHQQLKPSTADFHIETNFQLGISLFERMFMNDVQLNTLDVQHRMRPEISSLITPTIYPDLKNHSSVNERPQIIGIDKCLYFINHKHFEVIDEEDGTSKRNIHEVGFLIALAKHLILNGYKAEQVTILAAYLGQMYEFQKERKKYPTLLKNVRICVLDNYQGEESDIILLSLVRSNAENKIGFLSIENRVCVALSRARDGLYIMGNMDQLCEASELWRKIRTTLQNQDAIGENLQLRCQIHRSNVTYVKDAEDFDKIPEGGCDQLCESLLSCGHFCKSYCHIQDRNHDNKRCLEICGKILCDDVNHTCKKRCFLECGPCSYPVVRKLTCGHEITMECSVEPETFKCPDIVKCTLPCNHEVNKPCHYDPKKFRCPFPCETRVEPCGHACLLNCHVNNDPDHLEYRCRKPCAKKNMGCVSEKPHSCTLLCYEDCKPCDIMVNKKRSECPHFYKMECHKDVDEIECVKPCKRLLICGHKCKNKCFEPCNTCTVLVEKIVPDCEHVIKIKCSEKPSRVMCKQKCPRLLECGHPCREQCFKDCTSNCSEIVDCNIPAACGHSIKKIKCSLNKNFLASGLSVADDPKILRFCHEPCKATLNCGKTNKHPCSGNCGECFQGRFHKRCTAKCGMPLVCNHECEIPCREACKPCTRLCNFKCSHSKCKKKCGEPCTKCKESCPRSCQHQRCTNKCGDICSVDPCEEPCPKILKCGHPCIGFCGDPCPYLCRICNKDDVEDIFFGTEDDEDARFVMLIDCKHTLESSGMENWLSQANEKDNAIEIKSCPKCKTPIMATPRYSDPIKRAVEDVGKVKKRLYGSYKENQNKRLELIEELDTLAKKDHLDRFRYLQGINLNIHRTTLHLGNESISEACIKLFSKLQQVTYDGKRQSLNTFELDAISAKIKILKYMDDLILKSNKNHLQLQHSKRQISLIVNILMRNEDITGAEYDDIQNEIERLKYLIQIEVLSTSTTNKEKIVELIKKCYDELLRLKKFSESSVKKIKDYMEEINKIEKLSLGISEIEKLQIVKAMDMSKGHWFKCKNGHIYAIGECGGAMEESKCNECGASIGGRNHALRGDNAFASEMDGAQFPAWSQAANLANYRF